MSSYSLSNLSSTTKYGIAGFLVGGLGAYSLSVIWSGDSSSSSRSSSSSSDASGYGSGSSNYGSGSSNYGSGSNGSMFGGASRRSRHHKKHNNKTRNKK
jgi:hypothetical protein